MYIVNAMQIDYSKLLYRDKIFTGDASSLGLAPGQVPRNVQIKGKKDYVMYRLYEHLSDNEGWIYHADTNLPEAVGTRLMIFND